jgi:hypothetical protein
MCNVCTATCSFMCNVSTGQRGVALSPAMLLLYRHASQIGNWTMKAWLADAFVNGRITTGIGTTTSRTTHHDQKGARVAHGSVGTGTVGTTGIAIGTGTWNGYATAGTASLHAHLIGLARIVHITFIIVAAKAQISKVRIEQPSLQGSSSFFLPRRPQRVGFFGIQTDALVSGCNKRGPTSAETGTIASLFDGSTSFHVRIRILGI